MKPYFTSTQDIAVDFYSRMEETDRSFVRSMEKNEIYSFHHTVGMHIRNEYSLWEEDHPLTTQWFQDRAEGKDNYIQEGTDYHPNHPDNVCGEILGNIWDLCQDS